MLEDIELDIIIIGGGISGLWALNRLRAAGYHTILLEAHALGAGQTLKSQGIIHGGLKYALTGALTGSSTALETMPNRWKACLAGNGEIDLREVDVLSTKQLLWSTGSLSSDVMGFFASKALKSRVQKLKSQDYPKLLQHPQFKGQVYQLEEIVLNIPSLIQALAQPHQDWIFKGDPEVIFSDQLPSVSHLLIKTGQQTVKLSAKRYLFTAGEGNEALTMHLKNNPVMMQRRPLHMVLVKWQDHYPFFGHCVDKGMNPRITITSHLTQENQCVWYLGGQIAEEGVNRSPLEQIEIAKKELKMLFPWLELSGIECVSFFVNRAEAKQPNGKRPDSIFIQSVENLMIAWPTKLALAPLISDAVLKELDEQNMTQGPKQNPFPRSLEKPSIASPVWEELFRKPTAGETGTDIRAGKG